MNQTQGLAFPSTNYNFDNIPKYSLNWRLYEAVTELKDYNLCKALLEAGADPNFVPKNKSSLLRIAVSYDCTDISKLLIDYGASLENTSSKDIGSLLALSICNNNLELTELLLVKGLNPSEVFPNKRTPLSYALIHKRFKCAQLLLDYNADLIAEDSMFPPFDIILTFTLEEVALFEKYIKKYINTDDGFLLLVKCLNFNKLDVFEYLLSLGADINYLFEDRLSLTKSLILAQQSKYLKYVYSKGALIDSYTSKSDKFIPDIVYAASKEDYEALEFLFSIGEDINTNVVLNTGVKMSLLANAINDCKENLAKFLIQKGADVNKFYDIAPIHIACCNITPPSFLNLLIENRVDINIPDKNGDTPLHYCSEFNYSEAAEKLIKLGADINVINKKGLSPLQLAIEKNNYKIINSLVNSDNFKMTEEDERDLFNFTLKFNKHKLTENILNKMIKSNSLTLIENPFYMLSFAMNNRLDQDIINYFLELIPNINSLDQNGESLLSIAIRLCDSTTVKNLIKLGIDINIQNSNGDYPINIAVKTDNVGILNILLENGADVDSEGANGITPILSALKNKNTKISKILLEKNCILNEKAKKQLKKLNIKIA